MSDSTINLISTLSICAVTVLYVVFMVQGIRSWNLAERDCQRKSRGESPVGNYQFGFGRLLYIIFMWDAPNREKRAKSRQVRRDANNLKRLERSLRRAKYIKNGVSK